MQVQPMRHVRRAFTLIELLVVIAIIAILAAILFPVFATVREQARQSNTMSNMHSVYLGARLFWEDEGRYPPALFGYAETPLKQIQPTDPPAEPAISGDPITPMDKATGKYNSNLGVNNGYLYHEQVKDFNTFLCADNLINDKSAVTIAYYPLTLTGGKFVPVTWIAPPPPNSPPQTCLNGNINYFQPDFDYPGRQTGNPPPAYDYTIYSGVPKLFYKMDSMDIGPMIDQTGTWVTDSSGQKAYELHYSPDWTHQLYSPANGCDTVANVANGAPIPDQLKYKNPPTDSTILTWNTQHVATTGSNSVIIMLLSGTARKISVKQAYSPSHLSPYGSLPLYYNQ